MAFLKGIILEAFISFQLKKIKKLEDDFFKLKHTYKASDLSLPRFNKIFSTPILFDDGGESFSINISSLLFLNSFFKDIRKSVEFPNINLNAPTKADDGFFNQLENYKKYMGINYLGYTQVDSQFVFKNMAIPHKNALVLLLKLDNNEQGSESIHESNFTILQAYKDLWKKTLKLSEFIRTNGYSAYPGHPFLGAVSYTSLAKSAGLGWIGKNRLLIKPEFGSRLILSAVYTSIDNLPKPLENKYNWIEDYCESCNLCTKHCPIGALMLKGFFKTISGAPKGFDRERCYQRYQRCYSYSSQNYGYGFLMCVEKCPFNNK